MNSVLGNHIGLVVNNQDPEGRSRLQIFIPHLSNTIYKSWNESLQDVSFKTFSEDLFTGELKETILSTLPWAEAAVPIWGGGTGAPVYDSGEIAPIPSDQYVDTGAEGESLPPIEGDADEPLPPVGGGIQPFPFQGGGQPPPSVEPPLPEFGSGDVVPTGGGAIIPMEGGAIVAPDDLPPDQAPAWEEDSDNREWNPKNGINNPNAEFGPETARVGQPSTSSNSALAAERSKLAGELNNPDLRKRMHGLIKSEVGNLPPEGKTAFVETLFNRSYYRNQSLDTTASSKAYFGVYGIRPGENEPRYNKALREMTISEREEYDQLISRALGGSNYSNGAIHAGIPGDPGINEAVESTKVVIGGEIFYTKDFERDAGVGILADAQGENGPYSETPSQQVMRTTSMGENAVGSINASRPGGPMGVFSTPHIGAKVWVFFLGGNVQRPIYFANAYEPSNLA
jgi:hypothetical protein